MSAFSLGYVLASAEGTGTKDSVQNLVVGQEQIILALIAVIATAVAALVYTIKNNGIAKQGAKAANETNAAVNNIGPGEHRLYDMVVMIRDEVKALTNSQSEVDKKGWSTLPVDLGSATALTETIRTLQRHDSSIIQKLEKIDKRIMSIDTKFDEHIKRNCDQP
jgi:hypothetical protein